MITDQSLASHPTSVGPSSGWSDFDSVKLEISKDETNLIDYPFLDDCNTNPIFLVFIPRIFHESTRTFQTLSKPIFCVFDHCIKTYLPIIAQQYLGLVWEQSLSYQVRIDEVTLGSISILPSISIL